jgi:hypothetical protein
MCSIRKFFLREPMLSPELSQPFPKKVGMIYSLRGRCYIGLGTDEEKLAFLRKFAERDYLIAQPFPVAKRFHTTFVNGNSRSTLGVADHGWVDVLGGPEILFEEVFVELEKQLLAQTELSIGAQPLICITPLLADEHGNLSPVISRSGSLRNIRGDIAHENSVGGDLLTTRKCAKGPSRPDLVAAAMSANGGCIPLERDPTFRLRPNASADLEYVPP